MQLKSGQNNNGYVPYVDYARDYSPPPQTLSLQMRSNGSQINAINGQIPSVNSSLTRNRVNDIRQDNGLPSMQGSMNSLPSGLLGEPIRLTINSN